MADLGLLGVLELAALADAEEVHAGLGEARGEEDGVVDAAAALDRPRRRGSGSRRRSSAPTRVAHGAVDLERQPHPRLARCRRSRRRACSARRGTTPSCRRARSAARRRRSRPRARAAAASAKSRGKVRGSSRRAAGACRSPARGSPCGGSRGRAGSRMPSSAVVGQRDAGARAPPLRQRRATRALAAAKRSRSASSTTKKRRRNFSARDAALDGEEVDELDEELACARRWPRARSRPARAGRAGSGRAPMRRSGPLGTSRIPVASTTIAPGRPSAKRRYQASTARRDEALLGRAPGHHRRHPGARRELERAHRDRRKPAHARGFLRASASARSARGGRGVCRSPRRFLRRVRRRRHRLGRDACAATATRYPASHPRGR